MHRFKAYMTGTKPMGLIVATLVALLAVSMSSPEAVQGGWFGKNKKQKKEPKHPQRYDTAPDMMYLSGTLVRNGHSEWLVEGKKVQILPTTGVNVADDEGATSRSLRDGRQVILMGHMFGSTFVAREAVMLEPDYYHVGFEDKNATIIWSQSDPTVGVGEAPQ